MNVQSFLQTVMQKKHLTKSDTYAILVSIMQGKILPVQIGSLLTALSMKGETSQEILGFIQAMHRYMLKVSAPCAIDVCGTGGDGKHTFNISTAVAFVVAGAGVPVAKHGNRAASSKSGSADVLEALKIKIDLTSKQAETIFRKVGMVFLYAPSFHPSMRNVSSVRKELQIRTIFNVLGPFANPAQVKRQLIGVTGITNAKVLAKVARELAYDHVIIAANEEGMDEISMNGATTCFELKKYAQREFTITPEQFGFKKFSYEEIRGGNATENASLMLAVFSGKTGPYRDIILLNSGVALYVSGKAKTITEGIQMAALSIDTKQAKGVLISLQRETQNYA